MNNTVHPYLQLIKKDLILYGKCSRPVYCKRSSLIMLCLKQIRVMGQTVFQWFDPSVCILDWLINFVSQNHNSDYEMVVLCSIVSPNPVVTSVGEGNHPHPNLKIQAYMTPSNLSKYQNSVFLFHAKQIHCCHLARDHRAKHFCSILRVACRKLNGFMWQKRFV